MDKHQVHHRSDGNGGCKDCVDDRWCVSMKKKIAQAPFRTTLDKSS